MSTSRVGRSSEVSTYSQSGPSSLSSSSSSTSSSRALACLELELLLELLRVQALGGLDRGLDSSYIGLDRAHLELLRVPPLAPLLLLLLELLVFFCADVGIALPPWAGVPRAMVFPLLRMTCCGPEIFLGRVSRPPLFG